LIPVLAAVKTAPLPQKAPAVLLRLQALIQVPAVLAPQQVLAQQVYQVDQALVVLVLLVPVQLILVLPVLALRLILVLPVL